jgi:hypothetical protein
VGLRHESGADGHGAARGGGEAAADARVLGAEPAVRWRRGDRRERERSGWGGGFRLLFFLFFIFSSRGDAGTRGRGAGRSDKATTITFPPF